MSGLVKRETGENPVRTRHRNEGADAGKSLGNWEDGRCYDFKPGDLPECCTETFVSKPRVTGCTCGMQKRQKLFAFVSYVYKPFT